MCEVLGERGIWVLNVLDLAASFNTADHAFLWDRLETIWVLSVVSGGRA